VDFFNSELDFAFFFLSFDFNEAGFTAGGFLATTRVNGANFEDDPPLASLASASRKTMHARCRPVTDRRACEPVRVGMGHGRRFFAAPRLDPAGRAPIWRVLALTW